MRAPPRGAASALMRPPCASTIARAMARRSCRARDAPDGRLPRTHADLHRGGILLCTPLPPRWGSRPRRDGRLGRRGARRHWRAHPDGRARRAALRAALSAPVVDIPLDTAWSWGALFLGTELAYYWFHRASHRVRWLWTTHAVHHSATHFNLSAAIRLWTGQLTGAFVFFLPLAWIGFAPLAIGAMLSAGLIYQFFLHTAFPVRLGPLEWILNTPAHHRVHHSCNVELPRQELRLGADRVRPAVRDLRRAACNRAAAFRPEGARGRP